jgi:hypothetical protein
MSKESSKESLMFGKYEIPNFIADLVRSCEFEIAAWSEVDGALRGHGVNFIGTHLEIYAFLFAWHKCRHAYETKRLEENQSPQLIMSIVSIVSQPEVSPGTTVGIIARPQIPFRGMRVAVTDECAKHFDIVDMRVGNYSVRPQAGDCPAEAFATRMGGQAKLLIEHIAPEPFRIDIAERAVAEFGRRITMPLCEVYQDLSFYVHNRDKNRSHRFEGFILGQCISSGY